MNNLREHFQYLTKYIMYRYPFLYNIVRKCKIVVGKKVIDKGIEGRIIYFNPNWFLKLSIKQQVAVIIHEALHIARKDKERAKSKKYRGVYNVASDVVINEFVKALGLELPSNCWEAERVAFLISCNPDEVRRMSAEEIYYRLVRCGCTDVSGDGDVDTACVIEPDEDDVVVHEGTNEEISDLDIEVSHTLMKQMGLQVNDFDIYFNNLKPSKVNWREILRTTLINSLRTKSRYSWMKINRKLPYLAPGKLRGVSRRLSDPYYIFILMDVSGSIASDTNVLDQFFSEVCKIASEFKSKIILITWDDRVREIIEVRSPDDVKNRGYKGAGLTKITQALEVAIKLVRDWSVRRLATIVLTDGWIEYDNKDFELASTLKKISDCVVYAYTLDVYEPFRNWKLVRIP